MLDKSYDMLGDEMDRTKTLTENSSETSVQVW